MKRTRRVGLGAIVLVMSLPACHRLGGSNAERVDVPLSVDMRLGRTAKQDCRANSCGISYKMKITEQGTGPVYARDCHALALDSRGHTVFEGDFIASFPAGAYVDPTTPGRIVGVLAPSHGLSPNERASVHSLRGSCVAYVWHGEVPI